MCAFMRACVRVAAGGGCISTSIAPARLAQSAERKALNLVVVGSSPTVGAFIVNVGPAVWTQTLTQTAQQKDTQTSNARFYWRPAAQCSMTRSKIAWLILSCLVSVATFCSDHRAATADRRRSAPNTQNLNDTNDSFVNIAKCCVASCVCFRGWGQRPQSEMPKFEPRRLHFCVGA